MNLLPSLRYLVALNEHRHFGRAAQACHITQPALSNALRALEEEFAAVIVKRERNYVGLTPEGEIILASAQRMLHEHALLQESLKGDALAPHGPLRIGAVPTAVPVAARFAAMLQARQNGIRPIVLSLSSAELEKAWRPCHWTWQWGISNAWTLKALGLVPLSSTPNTIFYFAALTVRKTTGFGLATP